MMKVLTGGVNHLNQFITKIKSFYHQPVGRNLKPDNFVHFKRAYLRYLCRRHGWRWLRFSTIGVINAAIGFLILYSMVSGAGLKPIFGYLIENGVMLQISYILNRRLTFDDRHSHWLKCLLKWYLARAAMFGVGQGIFLLLVSLIGLQYLLASLIIAVALGCLNFIISNWFTFTRSAPTAA